MNTKIIAIFLASIVAMAVAVPMVIGDTADTSASVTNAAPTVDNVFVGTVTMDPCPANTSITVVATVSDENGVPEDIESVKITATNASAYITDTLPKTMSYNASSGNYEGTLNLTCCTPAAGYNVTVEAKDKSYVTDSKDGEFSVAGTRALSLNFDKVSFSGNPGADNRPGTINITTGESVANVTSGGNEVIDIGVLASNLTKSGAPDIDGDNMEASIGSSAWAIVKPKNSFGTDLGCLDNASAEFRLDIPAGTPTGIYNGILTISAEVA